MAILAGEGKKKGKEKADVCHITGVYDFGDGDVPIGHVISIAEPAYEAHIKHGDPEIWERVTLPDGSEACVESEEVICHITGTYDFGDGEVPIGQVVSIPLSAYQDYINQGDPETWKEVTLPDGSEACVEREEIAYAPKGYAFMGHDVETGIIFTQHLTPKMGTELSRYQYVGKYESLTSFSIDGKQYIMGHTSHKSSNDKYWWFIQKILPSGDLGERTDSGYFGHYYKTLIALERPAKYGGQVYIFGQRDYDDNGAFTMQVLPGGKLSGTIAWHDTWYRYYDAVTPLPNNYHTCFFMQDTNHKGWFIECIKDNGELWDQDSGSWGNGWQTVLSWREGGQNWLFGHRHRYDYSDAHYYGPWFIQKITDNSTMGAETDRGEWHNYYKTMTGFWYPPTLNFYLIGHNTDKHWFIQRVWWGSMEEEIEYGGPWANYYEHFFPIGYDKETYLDTSNWMGRLNDIIGDRKLYQIALPGSHDAGMNEADKHGCLAGFSCNTITQLGDIKHQLYLGSRFFDIRPMILEDTGVDWCTGHGQYEAVVLGCMGECKLSITDSLHDFFADGAHPNELVILKVSHCMGKPGSVLKDCTDAQIHAIANNLAWHLDEHLVKLNPDRNLWDMTLNELLELGNIILVVKQARDTTRGIFNWGYGDSGDYYNYDEYSNNESFTYMKNDQLNKLLDPQNHKRRDIHFLLSWTNTLSTADAIACKLLGSGKSILKLAAKATPLLYEYMDIYGEKRYLTKTLFPNVLYVDAFSRTATNAAIYLNKSWEGLIDVIWQSGTFGNPGAYSIMQNDGNYVIYSIDNKPLWSTGTNGNYGAYSVMQDDGNFVIYSKDDKPLWASGTSGFKGAVLEMQSDGNLVIKKK